MKRNSIFAAGTLILGMLAFAGGRWTGRHPAQPTTAGRRVLYWVDPMHPAYRSDKPGIAPDCGMALEPVYEGDGASPAATLTAGTTSISAERQRMIGIRVETAGRSTGVREIRTTGRIIPDDGRVYRVQAGFDGWVEAIKDTPTGTLVKSDQVLATLYGPDIRSAVLNYVGYIAGVQRVRQGMAQSDVKSFDDSLRVNEEQLRVLGMGEKQIQQINSSMHTTSSLDLVSPGEGIVLSRTISPHQRFEKGAEFYRIADLSKVWIVADVHGGDGEFRPGAHVKVVVPELGKTVEATVSATIPLFDDASRTLKVRLEADNPGFLLRPDMFVDVEFETRMPAGLSIPSEAVLDSGLQKIVYVETGDGVFEPRHVDLGDSYGGRTLVVRGISEGDRVVVAGNFLLDSETRMRAGSQAGADAKETVVVAPRLDKAGHRND